MEFLVTMTTHVPEGVTEAEVVEVRGREAVRSRALAAGGELLRLWRPPLQPGEWRSLGLFAADDAARLEEVLASMPLRIWRTDEVTPLSLHPNDPPAPTPRRARAKEFFTTFRLSVPAGVDTTTVAAARTAEAQRTRELAHQGYLSRLWTLPGAGEALGLWQSDDAAELAVVLDALPLRPWLQVETTPLEAHPSDPGTLVAAQAQSGGAVS